MLDRGLSSHERPFQAHVRRDVAGERDPLPFGGGRDLVVNLTREPRVDLE